MMGRGWGRVWGTGGPSPYPSWLLRAEGWEGPERREGGVGGHAVQTTGWHLWGRGTDGNGLGGEAGGSWRWHGASRRVEHCSPLIAGAWPPGELTQSLFVTPQRQGQAAGLAHPPRAGEQCACWGPGAVVPRPCPAPCLRCALRRADSHDQRSRLSPRPANHSARGAGHEVDEQPGDLSGQERACHSAHGCRGP